MMKGMPKPDGANENFIFDLDAPDMQAFEKFSDKMKDLIRGSREWRARVAGNRPSTTATSYEPPPGHPASSGFEDDGSDCPF